MFSLLPSPVEATECLADEEDMLLLPYENRGMLADTPEFWHFTTKGAIILHLTFSELRRGAVSLIIYSKGCTAVPTQMLGKRRVPRREGSPLQ